MYGRPNTVKSLGGGVYTLPVPKVGEVSIRDIAFTLARIARFNGGTDAFWSVGQHSLEVCQLCYDMAPKYKLDKDRAALAGLLHDAPEKYYGDIINPVKHHPAAEGLKVLTKEVNHNVFMALGVLDIMAECNELVRWADTEMLISDAARWNYFATYDLKMGPVTVSKHNQVPPPFELRFPGTRPLAHGLSEKPFLQTYEMFRSKVFGG